MRRLFLTILLLFSTCVVAPAADATLRRDLEAERARVLAILSQAADAQHDLARELMAAAPQLAAPPQRVEREAVFRLPLAGQQQAGGGAALSLRVRLTAERAGSLKPNDVADLCASFQAAIVDVIVDRTRNALQMFRAQVGLPNALVVAGGVAANNVIRSGLQRFAAGSGLKLILPPAALCTDNGAMIAWTGIERLRLGMVDDLSFAPRPRWPLDTKAQRSLNGKA